MRKHLADSWGSVDHAHGHINDLEGEIGAFLKKAPYRNTVEHDHQSGLDIHKIVPTERLPRRLSYLAFDAANNLRAALDQAGYAIALAAGNPTKRTHFPFGLTRAEVIRRGKGKGPSRDIPKDVFDVMVNLEPYRGGNSLLWSLNNLANTQKHQTILPFIVATGDSSIQLLGALVGPGTTFPPRWDRAKNEMEVMRVPHGHAPQYHLKVQVFIGVGEIEGVDGQPAVPVLRDMARVVNDSLMALEAESVRIGLFPA